MQFIFNVISTSQRNKIRKRKNRIKKNVALGACQISTSRLANGNAHKMKKLTTVSEERPLRAYQTGGVSRPLGCEF